MRATWRIIHDCDTRPVLLVLGAALCGWGVALLLPGLSFGAWRADYRLGNIMPTWGWSAVAIFAGFYAAWAAAHVGSCPRKIAAVLMATCYAFVAVVYLQAESAAGAMYGVLSVAGLWVAWRT